METTSKHSPATTREIAKAIAAGIITGVIFASLWLGIAVFADRQLDFDLTKGWVGVSTIVAAIVFGYTLARAEFGRNHNDILQRTIRDAQDGPVVVKLRRLRHVSTWLVAVGGYLAVGLNFLV